jgi:hypothetical protein
MSEVQNPARAVAGGDFRIGRVINRSVSILLRNFPAFFLLTLLASLPGLSISERLDWATGGAVALASLLLLYSYAVIIDATVQDMRGRSAVLREILARPFSQILALLGAGGVLLLVSFAGYVGAAIILKVLGMLMTESDKLRALLVVVLSLVILAAPMVLCAVGLLAWFVALPVCVVERLGPIRSLGRSRQLTKGYRWRILGLMLPMALITLIAGEVSDLVPLAAPFIASEPPKALVRVISGALADTLTVVVLAVTYHDLRVAREGVDIEPIADVFE